MKKRLLIGLLAVFLLSLCVSASAAEVNGDTDWDALSEAGVFTRNGVYYISDAEELRLFRDMINDHPSDRGCLFLHLLSHSGYRAERAGEFPLQRQRSYPRRGRWLSCGQLGTHWLRLRQTLQRYF